MSASQSAAASSLAGFIPEFTPASITSMSRGAPSESAFPAFGSDLEGFPSSSSTKSQNGNGNGAASVRRRQSERTSRAASEAAQGSEGEEDAYMDPIGQKQSQSSGQQKPKRKKATRACHACQKAHLTCDDERPCTRCIKRGLKDSCHDGKRKKAKYLQDYADEVLGRRAENPAHQKLFPQSQATNGAPHSSSDQQIPAFSHSSLLDSPPRPSSSSTMLPAGSSGAAPLSVNHAQPPHAQGLLDPSKFSNASDFGSHAANLEYAVLSSMLHGQTPPSEHNSSNTPNSLTADFNRSFFDTPSASDPFSNTGFDKLLAGTPSTSNDGLGTGNAPSGPMVESRKSETPAQHGGFDFLDAHQPRPLSQAAPSQPPPKTPCGAMRPQDVYNRVNKPYPYAQSYHDLIRHLKERFEKTDILRIVRALAVFRPSLIALQMPLTEEDEVFVERCFQRTLIEFEKLISFSGTPTVCWRRTGEICLVGIEFSLLTQWDRSELVGEGKKRFIFELFDQSTCVEYYESFAKHAFENSTQTIMSTCVLLTPDQKPVPCSFCFTIKRDMFNCPSLVVGQFLPMLLG